ncbi:hypothetical protein [Paraburkholderia sp. MM5477-R1]|uniref:hypothetical protein n=1 Tax=Paraburkholderia sp. MM5477-R1 TaxID=2991062 RepID=UPI003D2533D6
MHVFSQRGPASVVTGPKLYDTPTSARYRALLCVAIEVPCNWSYVKPVLNGPRSGRHAGERQHPPQASGNVCLFMFICLLDH